MPHLYFIDFQGALALNVMFQLLSVVKRLFYCPCSIFLDIPHSPLFMWVLSFSKVLSGKAGQGRFCSQIPRIYVVVSIVPFPSTAPQGGAGTGLRDSLPFRGYIHPQNISCICFSTDSFFMHIPRNFLLHFFSLRNNLYILKCIDHKYTVQ